jgi:hypothetical protein
MAQTPLGSFIPRHVENAGDGVGHASHGGLFFPDLAAFRFVLLREELRRGNE